MEKLDTFMKINLDQKLFENNFFAKWCDHATGILGSLTRVESFDSVKKRTATVP